jgi:acetyl esterase/lipase
MPTYTLFMKRYFMKKEFIALLFVFGLFFIACNTDDSDTNSQMMEDPIMDDPTPLTADVILNVSYGNNPQQVYDIYLPADRTNELTKTIILVHGGGWIEGDKEDVNKFIGLVRENNPKHAIVNMNYILASLLQPAFPNQFLDVDAVINQLTEQSETLQIKPEFGLIGVSAGAHISLQYDSVYDTDDQVKFVCDIVGPTDFTDPFYSDNPNFDLFLATLTDESAYPPGTDLAVALSPALQVNAATSPSILFYGNKDDIVPITNGETLKSTLEIAGITHQYTTYDGGHGDWDAPSFDDLEIKVTAFIAAHLAI